MDKDDIIKDYIAHLRNIAILSDKDLIKIVNRWIETDPKNIDILKEILYNNEIARFTTLTFAESSTFKADDSSFKDSGTEISIYIDNGSLSTDELKKLTQCIREIEQNNGERSIKILINTPEKTIEEMEDIINSVNPEFLYKTVVKGPIKTVKTIDRLIEDINLRLAEYIDGQFYLPLKEELKGTTHSLGFKKESLKEDIESELERLKKELKEIRPKIDYDKR